MENQHVQALIVDDDRAIQRLLADALSKRGFAVSVERDGEWAVATFQQRKFDVVLLDVLLPAINGYEVIKRLRALPGGADVPIICISGVYKGPLYAKEAVEKYGADALLEKPVRLSTLYATLQRVLGDKYPESAPKLSPTVQPSISVQQPKVQVGDEAASAEPRPRARAAPAEKPPPPVADALADDSSREEVTNVEQTVRENASGLSVLRGNLRERPFPELLAEIHRWRGTGALLLKREKVKKIVFFRDGRAESVKSNLLSECLGRIMVREKMISEAECGESLTRMKASQRQQGTVLVEMGCISPHNLTYALRLQLQVKLFDVFGWEDGDYQFNPKVAPPADPIQLDMSTAEVIHEGVRRAFSPERILQKMDRLASMYVHPSEDPLYALQDIGLGDEEIQLLKAADGHKTVSTLRALELLPRVETDRFLYAMRCAQMLEFKESAAHGKPRVSMTAIAAVEVPKPPPLPVQPPPPPLPLARIAVKPPELKSPVIARAASSLLPELDEPPVMGVSPEASTRERLAQQLSAFRQKNYFEILGVGREAGREEIKQGYFRLAREYHPDRHFGSASAEVRQLAQQLFDLVSTAHDTLSDADEKQRYVAELAEGGTRSSGEDVGKLLVAEGKFQKGEELLRQRKYRDAIELFTQAVQLCANEGEFHAFLGWTRFQLEPQNAEAALRDLERAASLNPKVDKTYLFTGYVYKSIGRPDKAEKQFERAIQCNPDCIEALRELRLLRR